METSNTKWSGIVSLPSNIEGLQNIILEEKLDPKIALISFVFDEGIDKDKAKKIAEKQLITLLRVMLCKHNMITYHYFLHKIEYKDHANVTEIFPTEQIIFTDLLYEDLSKLNEDMQTFQVNPLIELYMSAMKIEDATAKFVFLYSILLQKYLYQAEIDKYIRSCPGYENVEEKTSTKHKNNETIYTWLRNQVGHTQQDTDFDSVRKQITNYIGKLSQLVKMTIS